MTERLSGLIAYPGLIIRHRELLWAFVSRELRSRFQGSFLGRIWPILNPAILISRSWARPTPALALALAMTCRVVASTPTHGLASAGACSGFSARAARRFNRRWSSLPGGWAVVDYWRTVR